MKFRATMRAVAKGGSLKRLPDAKLQVEGADSLLLFLATATNYNRANPAKPHADDLLRQWTLETLKNYSFMPYEVLLKEHLAVHQKLFRRCRLDLGGWEAAKRLKGDPKTQQIPIIALTAHAMTGDREKSLEAGCDDYDTKPVDLKSLLAKMETLLNSLPNQ